VESPQKNLRGGTTWRAGRFPPPEKNAAAERVKAASFAHQSSMKHTSLTLCWKPLDYGLTQLKRSHYADISPDTGDKSGSATPRWCLKGKEHRARR